jgi:hypothetical protein
MTPPVPRRSISGPLTMTGPVIEGRHPETTDTSTVMPR